MFYMIVKEGHSIFAHSRPPQRTPRFLPLDYSDYILSEYRQKNPLKHYAPLLNMFIGIIFLLLFSVSAYAHPGKTDYRGGHKCWKGCSEWGLDYGEYHLHDKDWRPIRLDKRRNQIEAVGNEGNPDVRQIESSESLEPTHAATTEQKGPESMNPDRRTLSGHDYTTIYEENILPFNIILLLVLAIILLIALILIRRNRETLNLKRDPSLK